MKDEKELGKMAPVKRKLTNKSLAESSKALKKMGCQTKMLLQNTVSHEILFRHGLKTNTN